MKNQTAMLLLTFGLLSSGAAWAGEKTATLDVEHMTCAVCPFTVRKSLEAVEGVQKVKVSFADKTAVVTFDDEKTDVSVLTAATTNAGFPSRLQ